MTQASPQDYSALDQPRVLRHLFHPRTDAGYRISSPRREDMMIPVDEGIQVAASFHLAKKDAPVVLFFHGNGEIVSDYDDFGSLYASRGLNFFVVDYRGYGQSEGRPTVTSMMKDCQAIFDFVQSYRVEKTLTGPLCVMGRSLGSASAIELCRTRASEFNSLVIESGFALIAPLLRTLGVDVQKIGFKAQKGSENVDKIKTFSNPLLVIHAQLDHIIPFSEGQALFDACGSKEKTLLQIKGANHNDIFLKGMDQYLAHLCEICRS